MTDRLAEDHTESRVAAGSTPVWREYGLVLLAALAFYFVSVAPGVLWQDSGLAQTRVLQHDLHGSLGLALSHPLYYLLAFAFQSLPFSEPAFKTNLVSVVFGALTVANIYLFLLVMTRRRISAAIGALSLLVAHTFWQHCALAEVYTVSTALLSVELLCLCQYCETGKSRWLLLLMLANGLGVSNHMLAVLSLACYAGFALWALRWKKLNISAVPMLAAAWLVGAGIYITLAVGAVRDGQPLGDVVRSALFGGSYADNVLNVAPGLKQIKNSVLYLGLNFPTPTALLVIPGLIAATRARLKPVGVSLLALLVIHLAWAVRYDVPDQYTFFIPAIVLLTALIGLGAARYLTGRSRIWRVLIVSAAALPILVYAAAPRLTRAAGLNLGTAREVPFRDSYAYFLQPWKTGYRGAERFADELRDTLPENAVLIADSTTARPIYYMRLTRGWRNDVLVYPPLKQSSDDSEVFSEAGLAEALNAGRVYVVTHKHNYSPQWLVDNYRVEPAGVLYRVVGRSSGATP